MRLARSGSELRKWARATSISPSKVNGVRVLVKEEEGCDGVSLMASSMEVLRGSKRGSLSPEVLEESFRIFRDGNGIFEEMEGLIGEMVVGDWVWVWSILEGLRLPIKRE